MMDGGARARKSRIYYIGFLSFLVLWIVMTVLCYFGIIAFDPKSFSGAVISGLFLSFSVVGAIKFLKMLYDELYFRFAENPK